MRKLIYFLLLFSLIAFQISCDDKEDDLTNEIVGEYIGAFGSNATGSINPYEIIISRVDNDRISVKSKTGSEFAEWETDIERLNSSNISAPVGQTDPTIVFGIGTEVVVTFTISNATTVFTGQKQ